MSHEQNAGQNYGIKIANKSFETVGDLKYLGMALTNRNCVLEEIKNRVNLENASYN